MDTIPRRPNLALRYVKFPDGRMFSFLVFDLILASNGVDIDSDDGYQGLRGH